MTGQMQIDYKIMKLKHRYERLSLWNKIAFWGSCASIIGLPLSIILFSASGPSLIRHHTNPILPNQSAIVLHISEPKIDNFVTKQEFPHIRNKGEMARSFENGAFYLWFRITQQMGLKERFLVSYLNYYNRSFMEIALTSDESLEFRIYDARNKKHVLRYTHRSIFTEWANVVVTWESSTGICLYVNGVLQSHSATPSADFGVLVNEWYFGSHPQATVPLGGILSQLLLYDHALSGDQVQELYKWIADSSEFRDQQNNERISRASVR